MAGKRTPAPPAPSPRWVGLLAGVAAVTIGLAGGLVGFSRVRASPGPPPTEAAAELGGTPAPARLGGPRPDGVNTDGGGVREEVPLGVAPWEATPANTPDLPPDQVPAWEVAPPVPDSRSLPVPVVPPDPLKYEPPRHNPNGVDGERGPRPPS